MEPWRDLTTFGLVQFFMLVGLFGLLVPIFPGLVVMWLAALGYGIMTGFHPLGIVVFAGITLLMIAGELVDNFLMGVGARKGGASWLSIGLALAAGVVGTLVFPPLGGVIAAPLSVLLLEYWRGHDWPKAWRALRGLAIGWGSSFIVRFLVGLMIMGLWWLWVWQNQ